MGARDEFGEVSTYPKYPQILPAKVKTSKSWSSRSNGRGLGSGLFVVFIVVEVFADILEVLADPTKTTG